MSEGGADIGVLFERHADELHRYLARRVGAAADDLVGYAAACAPSHRP